MDNYKYLTEHEKRLLGYIEYIPCEYPLYNEEWYDEETTEIDALNDIFNL